MINSFYKQDRKWALERANCLPAFARSLFFSRWQRLHSDDSAKRRSANLFLLRASKKAESIAKSIGFFESGERVNLVADKLRSNIRAAIAAKKSAIAVDCLEFDLSSQSAVMRAVDSISLCRKVEKQQKRNNEHFARVSNLVNAKSGLYLSNHAFDCYIAQQKKTEEMLKKAVLICDDEKISLLDVFNSSVSNPKIRRVEMMKRINAMQEIATREHKKAVFLTLTCPSEYHASLKVGGINTAFDESLTVRDSQRWLCKKWQKIRAKLHRDKMMYYGLRVAEPHHDGTAHWHMLVFVDAVNRDSLVSVFERYMFEHCNNAAQKAAAFKCVDIDESRGNAAAYIAKYVSKNITGNDAAVDMSQDNALRVRAWASLWGIRQFQFFGLDKRVGVGVWRECRRIANAYNDDFLQSAGLSSICVAAANNDYVEFVDAALSFDVVKTLCVERVNRFGEVIKAKIGLSFMSDCVVDVVTKIKNYRLCFNFA